MATIRDIAARAGVSHGTVSNVLAGRTKGLRSDALRRAEEIRRLAAEMGYRPNAAARSMNSGRFNTVAVVTPADRQYLAPGLLRGMLETLEPQRMGLQIALLPEDRASDPHFVPRVLTEFSVDGLLLDYVNDIPPRLVQLIDEHRIPAIWVNHKRDIDCVYPDDLRGAREITAWLVSQGHRRIAFLGRKPRPGVHYSVRDRRAGYRQAMRSAGLTPQYIDFEGPESRGPVGHGTQRVALRKQWRAVIAADDRPTAVLLYANDEAVWVLADTCRACGLAVPEDVVIGVFADRPVRLLDDRPVPTARLPQARLGREAAAMLLERIAQPDEHLPARPLPLRLAHTDTPMPPRGAASA